MSPKGHGPAPSAVLAERLGVSIPTVHRWLRRLGLHTGAGQGTRMEISDDAARAVCVAVAVLNSSDGTGAVHLWNATAKAEAAGQLALAGHRYILILAESAEAFSSHYVMYRRWVEMDRPTSTWVDVEWAWESRARGETR